MITDPPPRWEPGGHECRTFLAVPVGTEARAFGVITIDGLQVGDLTEDDVVACGCSPGCAVVLDA